MISYLSEVIYLFVSLVDGAVSDEVVGVVSTGTDGAVHYLIQRKALSQALFTA